MLIGGTGVSAACAAPACGPSDWPPREWAPIDSPETIELIWFLLRWVTEKRGCVPRGAPVPPPCPAASAQAPQCVRPTARVSRMPPRARSRLHLREHMDDGTAAGGAGRATGFLRYSYAFSSRASRSPSRAFLWLLLHLLFLGLKESFPSLLAPPSGPPEVRMGAPASSFRSRPGPRQVHTLVARAPGVGDRESEGRCMGGGVVGVASPRRGKPCVPSSRAGPMGHGDAWQSSAWRKGAWGPEAMRSRGPHHAPLQGHRPREHGHAPLSGLGGVKGALRDAPTPSGAVPWSEWATKFRQTGPDASSVGIGSDFPCPQ